MADKEEDSAVDMVLVVVVLEELVADKEDRRAILAAVLATCLAIVRKDNDATIVSFVAYSRTG